MSQIYNSAATIILGALLVAQECIVSVLCIINEHPFQQIAYRFHVSIVIGLTVQVFGY